MQSVNFTSGIRPVHSKEFSRYTKFINPENFVDYPWTIASSRVAKDVGTSYICDCTGVLVTTGEKALMKHLNPAIKENHSFKKSEKYISDNIDLKHEDVQALVVGSNPKDAESSDIFNKFINFFNNYKIPTTVLKNGLAPTNIAYRTCTDEIIVSNKKIDEAIQSGKTGLDALHSGFEEVKIAECDYIV